MANGDALPDDVVDLIVHKLPLKSILKFRCCSTKWSYRLSDKRFSQMHYKLARCQKTVNQRLIITSSSQTQMESLDLQEKSSSFRKLTCPFLQRQVHDQVTLLGSSSGLVCASLDPHKNFYLWNPSTSFFRKLPDPDFNGNFSEEEDDVDFTVYHYGFGCVAATDDYKLLIGFRIDDSDFELFLLFSWKNQTWSDISGAPEWIDLIKQRQGVLSNEKLHWLFDHNHGFYELDEEEDCILAFDLENEVFGELSLPRCDDNDEDLEYNNLLGVSSEGRLYLLHRTKGLSKMICTSIWCMKEYGVTDSWTKLFDLKISHLPLEPIMNLAPIFVIEKYSSYGYRNTFTEIKYQHHPQPRIDFLKRENLADMLVCEETLVCLDDHEEEEEEAS